MQVFRISPKDEPSDGHFVAVRATGQQEAMDLAAVWADEWGRDGALECLPMTGGGFPADGPEGILFPFPGLELQEV